MQSVALEIPEFANIAEVQIKDALRSPEADEWLSAIQELKSIIANETWIVVDRLKEGKVIGSRSFCEKAKRLLRSTLIYPTRN